MGREGRAVLRNVGIRKEETEWRTEGREIKLRIYLIIELTKATTCMTWQTYRFSDNQVDN